MLDKALDELLAANPPVIEVHTEPRPNGQHGSPSKVYKLIAQPTKFKSAANSAEPAKREAPSGAEAEMDLTRNVRTQRSEDDSPRVDEPNFAHFAEFSNTKNPVQNHTDSHITLVSQNSQSISKPVMATDDVEYF